MVDKIAYMKEAEWVALLDEIRKKGGTTDKMTAEQAKQAVEALKIGGEDMLVRVASGQSLGDYVLNGVKWVHDGAFCGVKAKSISLPDALTLYYEVFKNARIDKIDLPNVDDVNFNTFEGALFKEINMPKVKKLSGFVNLNIESNISGLCEVEEMWDECFKRDRLASISYLNRKYINDFVEFKNIKKLGEKVFYNYQLSKKLSLPNLIEARMDSFSADNDEIRNYVLEELYVPKINYINIESQKKLKKITIGINTKIGRYGLKKCGFQSVDLKGVKPLGDGIFSDNDFLKYAKIKQSITGENIFVDCKNLKAVWISDNASVKYNLANWTIAKNVTLYVEANDNSKLGDKITGTYKSVNYGVTEEQFNEICKADNGGVEVPFDGIIYVDDDGNEVK